MAYGGDTFFHLSPVGRAGLLAISLCLAGLLVALVRRGRTRAVRLALAFGGFAVWLWLVPQVHYEWFRLVIDGLPRQWVFAAPDWRALPGLVTFTGPATLSAHGHGALFWALVAAALWPKRPGDRAPGNQPE